MTEGRGLQDQDHRSQAGEQPGETGQVTRGRDQRVQAREEGATAMAMELMEMEERREAQSTIHPITKKSETTTFQMRGD